MAAPTTLASSSHNSDNGPIRRWIRRLPRRWAYLGLGALLGICAPYGYFLMQSFLLGVLPLPQVWDAELRRDPLTYGYLFLPTTVVFAAFGYYVGRRFDKGLDRAASRGTGDAKPKA